jgi:hypothetical protein
MTTEMRRALENVRSILRKARVTLEEDDGLSPEGKLQLARGAISGALDGLSELLQNLESDQQAD